MASGTTGNNMSSPSDGEDTPFASMGNDVDFDGLPKNFIKYFKEAKKLVDQMVDEWSKAIKDTEAATGKMSGSTPGAGRLGLGSFTRAEKVGIGLGLAAFGASVYSSMAPNTMAAVTQRMGADTYAGLSGMSSRSAILQANSQVGGGATSAMGPTMAAMNLMYQGGYTANSLSSKNIMGQLAGLSAMTGMSNEQAAASMAGMNGMSFLRAGIQIRDSQGNLKPPNQIINDVYSFLYRGQKITKQQAALVMNPGSKGYQTIQQITGGDQALMQTIQAGIMARASNGSPLTASQMKDPNSILNAMGVDQSSPIRANFRYNSSENRKLAATEQGLVGGYDASLRTAASLNDAYSTMAGILGPVNQGLMTLKGILQTFPNAGGMGGTISGLAGGAMGLAKDYMGYKMMSKMLGNKGVKAAGGGILKGILNFIKNPKNLLKGGLLAAEEGLVVTEEAGSLGAATPAVVAEEAGIAAQAAAMFGKGGPSDHGNLGTGASASSTSLSFSSPVPQGTTVTSPFGKRVSPGGKGSTDHKGIDFGTPVGSTLTAVTSGHISYLGNDAAGYGNWIEVQHDDGTKSRYAHMSQVNVSRGQKVTPGQPLGKSGGKAGAAGAGNSTGPHLHFEILDEKGVKINPAPYLSGAPASPISSTSSSVIVPKGISGQTMAVAKNASVKKTVSNHAVTLADMTSPTLGTSLTSSGFNEDVGGPIEGMNIGSVRGSSGSRNVVINLQMKVNIAQGSVQEADRMVKMIGKKLSESDVLKKIGSAL
jgi:murein DD-endopeptidase MepM/ murein hydrolase activator NlpD